MEKLSEYKQYKDSNSTNQNQLNVEKRNITQQNEQQLSNQLLNDKVEQLNINENKVQDESTINMDNKQNQSDLKNEDIQNNQIDKAQKKKKTKAEQPKVVLPSLKILVLHGFQQYLERIEEKIQPWIKYFKKYYEISGVLIPEAPNKTLPNNPEDPFRCWLALNKEDPLDLENVVYKEAQYHFYEESEKHLLNILEDHPDIDIMINFSQGTLMGSLLYGNNRNKGIFKNLKMIINICGLGLPRVVNESLSFVNELYDEKNQYEIPSLFLIGEKDQIIPIERTYALMKWYKNKQIIKFDGPHCIPKQVVYLDQVKKYIDDVLELNKTQNEIQNQS